MTQITSLRVVGQGEFLVGYGVIHLDDGKSSILALGRTHTVVVVERVMARWVVGQGTVVECQYRPGQQMTALAVGVIQELELLEEEEERLEPGVGANSSTHGQATTTGQQVCLQSPLFRRVANNSGVTTTAVVAV